VEKWVSSLSENFTFPKLPAACKKLVAFQQQVIGLHKINYYFMSQVGSVSETPVEFSMLSNYIVNYIGQNYVVIKHEVMKRCSIGRW
jgi:hypothetical protein